jgi:hypothetical protein
MIQEASSTFFKTLANEGGQLWKRHFLLKSCFRHRALIAVVLVTLEGPAGAEAVSVVAVVVGGRSEIVQSVKAADIEEGPAEA